MNSRIDFSCFRYMGAEERGIITYWLEQIWPQNSVEENFLKRVLIALRKVNYDFWISEVRPSVNECEQIFFRRNCKTIIDMNLSEWEDAANRFGEHVSKKSRLATLYEGDLLKAYHMAMVKNGLALVVENIEQEFCEKELYTLNGGFVVLKTKSIREGVQTQTSFDYIGRELAHLYSGVFGVVTLQT